MSVEIERQFLIKELPSDLETVSSVFIRQGYLVVTKEKEIRIRSQDGVYSLTVKQGQGLSRAETSIVLTEDQFLTLWPLTGDQQLEKVRYFYPYGACELQIDCYGGALKGFNVAEVEFPDEQQSAEFLSLIHI